MCGHTQTSPPSSEGHPVPSCALFSVINRLTSQHNWERAEEFWPERWEQAPGPAGQPSAAGPPKAYLPFSDGKKGWAAISAAWEPVPINRVVADELE